jgi:subtilisin-like proprotein convertase family protein
LSWRWASDLALQVFPVPSGGRSNVGYSLVAPTTYRDGRYYVTYPRIPKGAGLSVSALQIDGAREPRIDGRPVSPGELLPLVKEKKKEKPAWMGDHVPVVGASYVKSDIAIEEKDETSKATVSVDLQHTYRGDLTLELITPDGHWHALQSSEGGSDNDVRKSFEVSFDAPMKTAGTWRLVVSDRARLDTGTLKAWSIELDAPKKRKVTGEAQDTPIFIPDAVQAGSRGQATISVEAPPIDTVAARLGSVPAAKDKEFFRLEIDTAPELRPMPKKLKTVFVVDASRSLPHEGLAPQLTMIRSFLSHVPDASFEIVAARRKAERVIGRFADASEIDEVLEAATKSGKLELGNGSNLDAGLSAAGKALRTQRGPRTIVVMSDALLRPSWSNNYAFHALKKAPGATVHVVLPTAGTRITKDRRDDDHLLSPIARKGGGVLLHVQNIEGRSKQLDAISLGLVRPIRIDDFQIEGVSFPDGRSLPGRLEEGDGLREMAMMTTAPKRVRLRGKIWAKPFVRDVKATLPFSKATAAFVFSHDMHDPLSEEEQFRLAMTAGAVSPMTSYLAIEPGVRPSNIGLEGRGQGFGAGHGRLGRSHRARAPMIRGGLPPFDLRDELKDEIAACVKTHSPPADWSVDLTLHLTFEEIVDIDAPKGAMARCLAEAAWDFPMPLSHFSKRRDQLVVRFPKR